MKTTIGWTYADDLGSSVLFDPVPLSELQKERSKLRDGVSACPSVKVFENRTIIIRSPYSFRIRALKSGEQESFVPVLPDTEIQPEILNSLIEFQPRSKWRVDGCPILQLSLPYIFFSDANAYVNQIESPFFSGPKNWSLIHGRFNIFDWQRPVNWSIEWVDTSTDLIVKREQPLFALLIETNNPDDTLSLKHVVRDEHLDRVIKSAMNASKLIHGTFGLMAPARKRRPKKLIR